MLFLNKQYLAWRKKKVCIYVCMYMWVFKCKRGGGREEKERERERERGGGGGYSTSNYSYFNLHSLVPGLLRLISEASVKLIHLSQFFSSSLSLFPLHRPSSHTHTHTLSPSTPLPPSPLLCCYGGAFTHNDVQV